MADNVNILPSGHLLHWYEIQGVLGRGGFGITYCGVDKNLNQRVAIKEYLPSELAVRSSDFSVYAMGGEQKEKYIWGLTRFLDEARTLARFDHPNIVRIMSVFESHGTACIVMRYEEGCSLQNILAGRKTLPEDLLLALVHPILDGLQLVHSAGFIHRDIKPANIFVREDGSPVLLDFGSARMALRDQSKSLTSVVSPGYAPFEQYHTEADAQGPWSDIYALGATLYRAVVGVAPASATDRSNALFKTQRDCFLPCRMAGLEGYSEQFLKAVDHALAFRESDRPRSIDRWLPEFPPAPDIATAATHLSALAETATKLASPAGGTSGGPTSFKRAFAVAVLPFVNLGSDAEQEYFADGITEEIIAQLSTWRRFMVISRNSTFRFKGRRPELKDVARDLDARYVVEGSVRRMGGRARISAELIDTETGACLWANRYDRDLEDMFAVQDEIANSIAIAVVPEMDRSEERRAASSRRESLGIWELTYKGLWHHYKMNKGENLKAMSYLDKAIALDPGCALALGWRAGVTVVHAMNGWSDDIQASLREALEYGKRCVEADPSFAQGHSVVGIVLLYTRQHDLGVFEARRGVELTPSNSICRFLYATCLVFSGLAQQAMEEIDVAIRTSPLDPYMPFYLSIKAISAWMMDDLDSALEYARKSVLLDPGGIRMRARLIWILAESSALEEAREEFSEMLKACPHFSKNVLIAMNPFKDQTYTQRLLEAYRLVGFDETPEAAVS